MARHYRLRTVVCERRRALLDDDRPPPPLSRHTVALRAADGMQAYHAHLRPGGRASGQVRAGQAIGYVSDSGNARGAGCHLHCAVGRSINAAGADDIAPWEFLAGAMIGAPALAQAGSLLPLVLLGLGALFVLDLLG